MDEEWKHISEFPDYWISNLGKVRNENRDRLVRPSQTKQGALKVGLVRGGKQYTRSLKVLVAEFFVPCNNELFDTPIQLDGDQLNVSSDNLMWRPRWFAWKYHKQMGSIDEYLNTKPVQDAKTGLLYSTIAEAAMINGLLFKEVELSVMNQIPVFPTWHHFKWANV